MVRIQSRMKKALAEIGALTEDSVRDFGEEAAKMAKEILRKEAKDTSTGRLGRSIDVDFPMGFGFATRAQIFVDIRTRARNAKNYGYGAPQEWGWNPHRKVKPRRARKAGGGARKAAAKKQRAKRQRRQREIPGKHYMKRAIFGTIARWRRGEKWRD